MTKTYSFLLTLAFLLLPAMMHADPITREQAKLKAEAYLTNCKGSRKLKPITNSKKLARRKLNAVSENTQTYYVFNRGESEGYVIVPGDDEIEGVLGYTDSGEFDYEQIPDNMRSWLDAYAQYIEDFQTGKVEAPRKINTHAAIPEMLTTKWNQGWPYNNLTPLHNGSHSVTGCVATAFAQVLYYQHEKSVDEIQDDIPGYTTWTEKLVVPGISKGAPIDWDHMLGSYGGSASGIQQTAVAQLMLYCGVAVEMDYTNSSSGAHTERCAESMNKHFGYSTARYVYKANYTDEGWDELIYNELREGRVVLLSGYNSEAGHAFVCDGYDGNRCYHINWGWGGQSDGHFLMNSLNPSSQGIGGSGDGYSEGLGAVIGALPDNYDKKALTFANATVKKLCIANFDADGDGVFTYGEAAAVTDLGEVFKGQRFNTFDELYYFTGLKNIADGAFSGNTLLTNITLPKAVQTIGDEAFSGCSKLKTLKYFENIKSIGAGAFNGCRALPEFSLPEAITEIKERTFAGCAAFTEFTVPVNVKLIGTSAFEGCTKLTTFTVNAIEPAKIQMGETVFNNINLENATLITVQGTEEFYRNAEQWKEFGNFKQERNLAGGSFCELVADKEVYLYNEGTGRYLTKGEAWGTQAIVGNDPMKFILKRTTAMPEGTYYLYSDDTGKDTHILFRTTNDSNVGTGVRAAFVDGDDSHINDKSSWWNITKVDEKLYTIQVPAGLTGYTQGKFWGVQTSHKSNAASPTYGVYNDIVYDDYKANCQWRFVEYDEMNAAKFKEGTILGNLLAIASNKNIDTEEEQVVYDDINSSVEQMRHAQKTLRKKLGFIHFKDEILRDIAVANWDADGNGEITYSEASKVAYFNSFFYSTAVKNLEDLEYFTGVNTLYGNTFQGCSQLEKIYLPEHINTIYYWAFRYCDKLQSIDLPNLTTIGERVFGDCKALKSVSIATPNPNKIDMGENVFENVDVKNATLYVPQGSKELYERAPQWKEFGKIEEMRAKTQPPFAPVETDVQGYIYNLGEERFMNRGEAWGTQAIVASTGMVYQIKRTSAMPDGLYYLYSDATGKEGKILFRTDGDSKVGTGIKACFVDGTLSEKAYWKLNDIGDNIFTLEVPEGSDGAGDLLGVDTSHASEHTYGTYGAYWDFKAENLNDGMKWGFILLDDKAEAELFDNYVKQLKRLLEKAQEKGIDSAEEQAVYNNFESTQQQVIDAIESLKRKMGYIEFADSRAKTISTNNWDEDDDAELSFDEAQAVTKLGARFKGISAIKSLEELRYFSSITEIQDEAFRGCSSLTSLYLPKGVTKVGEKAFTGCSALKYMAILAPQVVEAQNCGVSKNVTIFVPDSLVEAYMQDETWGKCTVKPFTGTPVVRPAEAYRTYGVNKSSFEFEVEGAPVNGEPELSNDTELTTPVGEYTIYCKPGNITSPNLVCEDGVLTINPATLTITAKSFTRNYGEENPEFTVSYRGWKNKENVSIFTSPVVITCEATTQSPGGEYDIVPSGAVAPNYEIVYVNGTLTVVGGEKPGDVNSDGTVDISDIVAIINQIAGTAKYDSSDVNNDGKTDISDIVAVINIIAGQ